MKTIRVKGSSAEFRVGKIFCLGRNYAEHSREMNATAEEHPIVFLKPDTAIIQSGEDIVVPPISREMHHEVELVVAVGREGKSIPAHDAMKYVFGYAAGLDMTLRDVQREAKSKGLPWVVAKGFDTSAPISEIVPASSVTNPYSLTLTCRVNGQVRQRCNTGEMVFRIDRVIEYLSTIFSLERGDLIFTGTPSGVGPVCAGDTVEAELEGLVKTTHRVRAS